MESITEQVRALANGADNTTRKMILGTLRDVALSLKTPRDTLQRICSTVVFCATSLRREQSKETIKDTFTANNVTKALAMSAVQSGVYHNFDNMAPAIIALPEFLKQLKYQDITSPMNTSMQIAFQHSRSSLHLDPDPTRSSRALQPVHGNPPFEQPTLANKMIAQASGWRLCSGLLSGTRCYFLGNIVHDCPDYKATLDFKNIAASVGPDSVILINDMVLSNAGAHWHITQVDLAMMTMLTTLERAEGQWCALMEKAGLRINRIGRPATGDSESVLWACGGSLG
ncbi:hypothetical protein BJX64DRAFT_283338 [Aspergillus heterothallicus]